MDLFEDVTFGMDVLYSIPSTGLQHRGTYQCEIYSEGHSIVRLYFYLSGKEESHSFNLNSRYSYQQQYNPHIILSPVSAHISSHALPLSVTPQPAVGHTELQEIFDLCLLPGGQLLPGPDHPPSIFHPTLVLLTACFTSVLLVVFLSLG